MSKGKVVMTDQVKREFMERLVDVLYQAETTSRSRLQLVRFALKLKNDVLMGKMGFCKKEAKKVIYSALISAQ